MHLRHPPALGALFIALCASPLAHGESDSTLTRGALQPDDFPRQIHGRLPQVPKVILISLDGARPDLINKYLRQGTLPAGRGIGLLKATGTHAEQNVTATPSVTAVSHIAIATGSTAVRNDIPANTFHPVAAAIGTSISGFAAPIGGYQLSPIGPAATPTAEPLWVRLRAAGKKVVTATWPGADGADVRIGGASVQAPDPTRITDYTVPFGAFGGLSATGFQLSAASFADATPELLAQLAAAGRRSFSPVRVAPVETFHCASSTAATCGTSATATLDRRFDIRVAALDSTDDHVVNYDTLVFSDAAQGISAGPFALPATGPAYLKAGQRSARFYLEGTGNRIGTAYFVSHLAPDLSTVRFARYAANYIPRNAPVLASVEDINENAGFWAPQPDYRIPERLSPGFTAFPDAELEAMYSDQVRTFVAYQTAIALHAIRRNADADLVMIYIEQPDGSGHQFTLTDPRQATNPLDPTSIGSAGRPAGATGQDRAKIRRYDRYLRFAYQQADKAVQAIIDAIGYGWRGAPRSNVVVVSDHGMAPFHTAVSLRNLLANAGIDTSRIGIRTTGPAAHVYVNLQGREAGGTVSTAEYPALVAQIADILRKAADPNPNFNYSHPGGRIFSHVATRPLTCAAGPGRCTSDEIGQDSGDSLVHRRDR